MAGRKKPVLRLTIFFISVVLISGSILAYFSVNNISNLKELTEKRVLEEQRNLALVLLDQIEEEITESAEKFSGYWEADRIKQAGGFIQEDTFDLIGDVFVVDETGEFIWPWFIESKSKRSERVPEPSFQSHFIQAERAEFIERNYGRANGQYLASLRASLNTFDSAQSLNALARLSVKMEDSLQAFNYYTSIISTFSNVCDPNGFPYVYYAIPQLIKISKPSMQKQIMQEIDYCLKGMEEGSIPLNHSSTDILKQLGEWMDVELGTSVATSSVTESIQTIQDRLSFLDRNRELIRGYLFGENMNGFPEIPEGYQILNNTMQNDKELILVKRDREILTGFTMDIEQLWAKVSGGNVYKLTEFEYEIELKQTGNGVKEADPVLLVSTESVPYFLGYRVFIKLGNEALIDELVQRRSWIYGIALSLLLGGMILGILLILRDISREEHLARLRADFISNVTHELKTPLTSIHLFTESIALDRIKTSAQKKEYLQIILKETESLKRMINNILDFSRKGRGKREFHFENVNISALIHAAIDDLEYWLVEKKFTLIREIEDKLFAWADHVALKQAIINLLNNAIKFSVNRKEIVVRLKSDQKHILFQIEDKGIGIPEDQKDLIFQPFYRVGQKNSEDISGTGLGLSVVKEIIEAHHGTIMVDSRLDEGSRFTICINATQENLE